MWGRFWNNLYNDVVPYPDRPNLDVSEQMKLQGYDVKKMFESADDFYAGMGLQRVNKGFWNKSMLVKPDDGRKVVCHATAWDFYDGKVYFDFFYQTIGKKENTSCNFYLEECLLICSCFFRIFVSRCAQRIMMRKT